MIYKIIRLQFLLIVCFIQYGNAQHGQEYSSSEIMHELQKLQFTARVLYIAAHPDDENTRLISYLANGKKYETAYLSLTRGDGGQNVIGPELREGLGLIRTQELLAARRIDGGNQFFTRANDFGYSKTPAETFDIWDRDKVLADVVWVIRNFQPDIIITRFNETPGTTHGHHTGSAILAREAFQKAAEPTMYPEQLKYVSVWKTKKLYWNTSSWFFRDNDDFKKDQLATIDVGGYNPIIGQSYPEIAAKSRSQHKSQAFGSSGSRGEEIEYLEQWEGSPENSPLFEGVSETWLLYENGVAIQKQIETILSKFDYEAPEKSISDLFVLRKMIKNVNDGAVKTDKLVQIDELIIQCSGFYHLLSYNQNYATPGDSLTLNLELVNRSSSNMKLKRVLFSQLAFNNNYDQNLGNNKVTFLNLPVAIPNNFPISNPYWLNKVPENGMYLVEDQLQIGKPESDEAITATILIEVEGELIEFESPLVFKTNDRIKGEVLQPLYIVPEVSISFSNEVIIFTEKNQTKEIAIQIKSLKSGASGTLELSIPENWKIVDAQKDLSFSALDINQSKEFKIKLISGNRSGQFNINAQVLTENGKVWNKKINEIQYDHLPNQVIATTSNAQLVLSDIKIAGKNIGYIEGAGDAVKDALNAMGYKVTVINIAEASTQDLKQFDAIVAGIRAYNTNTDLQNNFTKLFNYMEQGGTYVVQYNTTYGLPNKQFWPYPMQLSRDRITSETAEMKFLKPNHKILNYPNKITEEDFKSWNQERGLYFPGNWDTNYVAILEGHDPGEEATQGALLVARYGKGKFVYTGLSFFRELPAGVPGSYRLFANLLSEISD
jgi:LmbE family N-acetylglucosaminyl deacetylase